MRIAYPDPRGLSTLAYDLGYTYGCIGGDRPFYSHTDLYLMNRFAVPNVPMPALLRDMLVSLVETRTTR